MANQLVTSLSALGIALAPALLKFAEVPRNAELDVDGEAAVSCVTSDNAPVHARFGSTGTVARLAEGAVVQVLSKRKEWRHVAYVEGENAELGWLTTSFLGPCEDREHDASGEERPSGAHRERPRRGHDEPIEVARLASSPHAMLGVPTDDDPSDDILLDHGIYVLSYNPKRNDPNWVAWKLKASDLGDEDRQNDFRADDDLPDDVFHVAKADYNNSGFDRGHMCPSAQRTSTPENNSLTFLMTNMQPQVHALNGGVWKSLETFERNLADTENKELYVVAGGLFPANPKTIGHGVAVPKRNFRVTVVLDAGQRLDDVTATTPVFAVEMPNDNSVRGQKWTDFKVTVDQVEEDSGYDFLSKLPDALEKRLEGSVAPDP